MSDCSTHEMGGLALDAVNLTGELMKLDFFSEPQGVNQWVVVV